VEAQGGWTELYRNVEFYQFSGLIDSPQIRQCNVPDLRLAPSRFSRMGFQYRSSAPHTGFQYCAVDSMTTSPGGFVLTGKPDVEMDGRRGAIMTPPHGADYSLTESTCRTQGQEPPPIINWFSFH
jgi:hypothetical protein